jgi:hypothetical protein
MCFSIKHVKWRHNTACICPLPILLQPGLQHYRSRVPRVIVVTLLATMLFLDTLLQQRPAWCTTNSAASQSCINFLRNSSKMGVWPDNL